MQTPDQTSVEILPAVIERFWETFPSVWDRVRNNLRKIIADQFDISVEQFQILRLIRKGAGSVSELAAVKQISRSAISQAVDILVERGLIARQTSSEDRRYIRLELTPAGNALMNTAFEKNRAWMANQMVSLSPAEIETILQGLQLLKDSLDKPAS